MVFPAGWEVSEGGEMGSAGLRGGRSRQGEGEGRFDGDGASRFDALGLLAYPQLFEQFPYGLALVQPDGEIEQLTPRARALLLTGEPGRRRSCCELICSHLGN